MSGGYEYGVWLVPLKNESIKSLHQPHITVMCNMRLYDACHLYYDISKNLGSNYDISLNGECVKFKSSYEDNDPLDACGYWCKYKDWSIFEEYTKNYKGSSSKNPHLSFHYAKDAKDLKYENVENTTLKCKLCVADITHGDPEQWFVLHHSGCQLP